MTAPALNARARPALGARARWTARAATCVVACLLALAAWARPAAAAPRLEPVARAGRVSVLAEPGLDGLARDLASSAERELDRIAADLLDLPAPRAIEVRLVHDANDLPAIAPAGRGAPAWAIGVAYPDLGIISLATRRGPNLGDPQTTLRHELAHVALGVALGDRAPHWLHEGFAYQHAGEWSWERTETLAGMAWAGGIIPLDQLDQTFPEGEQPAHRAYAESYDFVGYLSRRGRWEDPSDDGDRWPFRRFLRELGHGSDLDAAAYGAFGKPLRGLFEEWRSDLGNRYMLAPMGLFGLAVWVVCAILLSLAWWRRRRQNRRRLAQWELEDQLRHAADSSAHVVVPPYVAWPGEDPLTAEPDEEDRKPGDPRWLN
ncbi:MAG TPA: hypothetical protein VFK02_03490 [Kofleriaceae bacterium]|nr:hypothetical protein [Kofleriaceae bacterium]